MNHKTEQELYFKENDKLGLATYANNIKRIIEACDDFPKSNDNEAYVIGIDSPWGTGKTQFVKMLKNYLLGYCSMKDANDQSTNKTIGIVSTVLYYDAWKNDFWDNAFEPLFDQMIQATPIKKAADKADIKRILKLIPKILCIGARGFIVKQANNYIEYDALKEMSETCKEGFDLAYSDTAQTEQFFPEYSQFRDAIATLRKFLSSSIETNKKTVIIIDELDRCKPTFAVQTLEIVKHLFNVEGLVFIFSLDIHQLSHCIKLVYGTDFDAVGYLERFFNYLSLLPRSNSKVIIANFLKEFGMEEKPEVVNAFSTIIYQYGLSLREARTVLSAFYVLEKTSLAEYCDISNSKILYFYFLCMKYKMPKLFSKAVFQSNTEEVFKFLSQNKIPLDLNKILGDNCLYDLLNNNPIIDYAKYYHVSVLCDREHSNAISIKDSYFRMDGNKLMRSVDRFLWIEFLKEDSLSYLLYFPDILDIDNIKEMRVWEFLYRKLELCDFVSAE